MMVLYSEKIRNRVLVHINLGLVLRDVFSTSVVLGDKNFIQFGCHNSSYCCPTLCPVNILSCASLEGIVNTEVTLLQAFLNCVFHDIL